MSNAVEVASLPFYKQVQIAFPSDLQAAEMAYNELRHCNLLEMSPVRRQRAIKTMAQAKIIIALQQEDVRLAIEQRGAELGGAVSMEERLAIAKHFVPDAFTVRLT